MKLWNMNVEEKLMEFVRGYGLPQDFSQEGARPGYQVPNPFFVHAYENNYITVNMI